MQNNKSKEELVAYGKTMIERGDRWASVINYLNNQNTAPELQSEIISGLEEHERIIALNHIRKSKTPINISIILGLLLIGGAIGMAVILWDMGWISTLPFIIISGAIWAMTQKERPKPF